MGSACSTHGKKRVCENLVRKLEGKRRQERKWQDNIKNSKYECGPDSSGLVQRAATGCCAHGYELAGFAKGGDFLRG